MMANQQTGSSLAGSPQKRQKSPRRSLCFRGSPVLPALRGHLNLKGGGEGPLALLLEFLFPHSCSGASVSRLLSPCKPGFLPCLSPWNVAVTAGAPAATLGLTPRGPRRKRGRVAGSPMKARTGPPFPVSALLRIKRNLYLP